MAWIRSPGEPLAYDAVHPGLIELFLTLSAEATSPDHPARTFVQERYAAVVAEHVRHLFGTVGDGEVGAMSEVRVEHEVRLVVAATDANELQWLLDPRVEELELFLAVTLVRRTA